MVKAFIVMTAMPPTKGHANLIKFARLLDVDEVRVIVCTQPGEPYTLERVQALEDHFADEFLSLKVPIYQLHRAIEQNPEAEGFWDMWRGFMRGYGFKDGDYIVASESYGQKLAEVCGGRFMPYDPDRDLLGTKATRCREKPRMFFPDILPEFQDHLRLKVTIFGAESTGKTTLARSLAATLEGHFVFEWARPYLENAVNEITTQTMTEIWEGQRALQDHVEADFHDKPFIIQDTDLFSTVGYWDFWNMQTPEDLVAQAAQRKSDLYLICQSNIPFEEDPLRYGGDKRESDDQFWIDLCKKHGLKYRVLSGDTAESKLVEASAILRAAFDDRTMLAYERQCN